MRLMGTRPSPLWTAICWTMSQQAIMHEMALPAFIETCLPSPGERPPTGPNWIHEIKHGYRLMARRDALSVGIRLLTRNGARLGVPLSADRRGV